MRNDRKNYAYYPRVRMESPIIDQIEKTNKLVGKIGVCVGVLGIGGYFLYKKVQSLTEYVRDLAKECKKTKEETEK